MSAQPHGDAPAPQAGQGPRVSVVMPAYDAQATLEASMRSVLEQQCARVELIVVDDRSRDASAEIAGRIAETDPRVVVVRQPANAGVAAARNAGIEAATGDYIAFLDSDDTWHPGKLAAQLDFMRASDVRICYAAYRRVDERGRQLSVVRPPARVTYADMLKSNRIGNLTGIYHRSLGPARFQRVGHEDYVFWLQLVRRAGSASRLPDPAPVADYLVRSGSLSSHKARAARWQWHIYRGIERLGRAEAGWYFLHYAANAALKRT